MRPEDDEDDPVWPESAGFLDDPDDAEWDDDDDEDEDEYDDEDEDEA